MKQAAHMRSMGGSGMGGGGSVHPSYHNQQSQSRLRRYELLRPDKKDLGPGLGPPDFYPLDSTAKEETLKAEYIIGGFQEIVVAEDSKSSIDEFKGLDLAKLKDKLLQAVYEVEWKKNACPQRANHVPVKERQGTNRRPVPEQNAWNSHHREAWVVRLAGSEPLQKLAQHVPHGYKGETLLKMFLDNQIPLIRATWYTKIVYGNMPKHKTVEPSTDWTKTIMQSLFALIRNNPIDGDLKKPSIYAGLLYIERLIRWNFYEGLLNKDILLTMLIDHLNETSRSEETVIVASMILYYSDTMIQSTTLSLRFLFKCHDKMTKISLIGHKAPNTPQQSNTSSSTTNSTAPSQADGLHNRMDLSLPNQKTVSILCTVAKQVAISLPDVFMSFKHYKDLVSFIWPSTTSIEKLEALESPANRYFTESALMSNTSNGSVGNNNNNNATGSVVKKLLDYSDLIDVLDRFTSHNDIRVLYNEIFGHQISLEDDKQKILLVCEWAITGCRKIPYLHIAAASLLKLYEVNLILNQPLQNILVNFLETFKPSTQELKTICCFYSEMTRNGVFSQNSYARYLISRGVLEHETNGQMDGNNHRYYLQEFPIFNQNDVPSYNTQQQRNQRRTILFASSLRSQEEIGQMESVRDVIRTYLLDPNPAPLAPIVTRLLALSFHCQMSLVEWLSLCVRIHFSQTLDALRAHAQHPTSVLRGFQRLEFPMTEHYLSKCFALMEATSGLSAIVQCLLVLWRNWSSAPHLHRFIFFMTTRIERQFIYSERLTTLLDILLLEPTQLPTAYLTHLLHHHHTIKSIEQWMLANNIILGSNSSIATPIPGTTQLIKSELTFDESMTDKTQLSDNCTNILNKLLEARDHYELMEGTRHDHGDFMRELMLGFEQDQLLSSFTQQEICTEMINSLLATSADLREETQQKTLALFLTHFAITYPMAINHDVLFCRLLRDHIASRIRAANSPVALNYAFDPLSSLLKSLITAAYIDMHTLLEHAILPPMAEYMPPSTSSTTATTSSVDTPSFSVQNLWFFVKLIQALLQGPTCSSLTNRIQTLTLLFPTFCRLYAHFEHQDSSSADHALIVADIKSVLTDPDFKHVLLIDSQRHLNSMRSVNLDAATARLLFSMVADKEYEKLRPDTVINHAYQVVNNTLSTSFACYWYIQLSYMELRLLLDEWQSLPPLVATPPLRSPTTSPLITPQQGAQTLSTTNAPATTSHNNNSPESILTQFILCHFEQNRGWQKTYLYEKLFLCLPVSVRNELIKLTTVIMESQYEGSSFEAPDTRLYLFSHILSNLPVRKRPPRALEGSGGRADETLLQESFTELIINILAAYEPTSTFLQTFALSLLRQLNQFLGHTKIYDAVNMPTSPAASILHSLSMRIAFLVPLIGTIRSAKTECHLEELSVTLLRLLSRGIVQSDEDYDFFNAILTMLDLLLSDKHDQLAPPPQQLDHRGQVQQAPDPRVMIKRKLHENYQATKHLFPVACQRKIERQISFLSPTSTSTQPFQIVIPPSAPASGGPPTKPQEIKPTITQMDPWSLLEDFADTPMSPSTFGGVRMERKDLTYIKSSFPAKSNHLSEPSSPLVIDVQLASTSSPLIFQPSTH
eukprot:gene8380-9850_t